MEITSGKDLYNSVDQHHLAWVYNDVGERAPLSYDLTDLNRVWGVWKNQNMSYSFFYHVSLAFPWRVGSASEAAEVRGISITGSISMPPLFTKDTVEACAKAEGLRYVLVEEKDPGYVRLFYPHDAAKEHLDKFSRRVMALKPVSVAVEFLPWEYR